jgi:hypothetical protein
MAAMEFSYTISEAEFIQAWKLRMKSVRKRSALRKVIFWSFILVCLLLLWVVVQQKSNHAGNQPPASEMSNNCSAASVNPPTHGNPFLTSSFWLNVGPFVLLASLWVFLFFRFVPARLRKLYLNDPVMQGTFTVSVAPDSISVQNNAGSSGRATWNIYERWHEGKSVIILIIRSQTYLILSVSALSEAQRAELRSILAAALPKK